jgi:hypothetical protein
MSGLYLTHGTDRKIVVETNEVVKKTTEEQNRAYQAEKKLSKRLDQVHSDKVNLQRLHALNDQSIVTLKEQLKRENDTQRGISRRVNEIWANIIDLKRADASNALHREKASDRVKNVLQRIGNLKKEVELNYATSVNLDERVENLCNRINDADSAIATAKSDRIIHARRLDQTDLEKAAMMAAMNGDMVLWGMDPVKITAASLNAAAAESLNSTIIAKLNTAAGDPHLWAGFAPEITPAEFVTDADVAAPSVVGTPVFNRGVLIFEIQYDTDEGATKTHQAGTKSTGSITVVAKANLVDTDYFALEDALGTTKTFEYDVAGDGVTEGRIAIDVSELTTAEEVANATLNAINASSLKMQASSDNDDTVDLEQNDALAAGDTAIVENVADAGFTKVDFTRGVDRDEFSVQVQISATDTYMGHSVSPVTVNIYVI